jgi:tetratricopeptide (TPR) repeat protein
LQQGYLERALGQFEAGLNLPAAQRGLPDLDLAIRALRQAITKNPEAGDAYLVLGRLLGTAGADASQVIAAFQDAIRLRPVDAEAHNSLGLVYVQTGDDEKAIVAFREAIRLRPDYADAHQNLGAVLTTSDAGEAVRELETAMKLQPRLLKAQYNLALAYEASPKHGPSRAIGQMRSLLAAQPDYPRAEFMLGRLLLRDGKVEEAVDHLHRAVEREPEFGEARYQFGLALSRAGRRDDGNAEIRKSRELIAASENRQVAALDLAAAKAALEKGDRETAVAKARKVLQFEPNSGEAKEILKKLPTDPTDAIERQIRDGKFEEAEQALRAYVADQPKSAWAWYALGYSLYGQRKIGESIKALAQSLQLDVKNADAHKVLGRDLMIIGRFDAARLEFEQGKRLNPKSAEMPYNLGKLYSIQDNWPDARREFEAALRLDPSYMEAFDGLGFALEALGDDEAAVTNYKKAIELCEARHAGFASAYVNMSTLLNRTGDREAALEFARKGLAANPKSDRALFQMAKAYEYKGDWNAAAGALNQAIELNPRASSYFYVLASVYRKLGKTEESRAAMGAFSRLDRESNELEEKRRELLKEK